MKFSKDFHKNEPPYISRVSRGPPPPKKKTGHSPPKKTAPAARPATPTRAILRETLLF